MGTPLTMLANPTPHSSAGSSDPQKMHWSHTAFQRGSSLLRRNSNATPRTMSATRMRNSAR